MKRTRIYQSNTHPIRVKTLSVIADGIIQKIGELEIIIAEEGKGLLEKVPLEFLNMIKLEFEQVGKPMFTTKVVKDKMVNCGFVRFRVKTISIPAIIPDTVRDLIYSIFFNGNQADILTIPMQGEFEVYDVQKTDDIEEIFDVENAAACFSIRTIQGDMQKSRLSLAVVLVIKAAVKAHIIVSRYKIVTAQVSDVKDIVDFEG